MKSKLPPGSVDALLNQKSGFELRLVGAIKRLRDTNDPAESFTIDEIKAAVRALFPHLELTNLDLDRYIADADEADSVGVKIKSGQTSKPLRNLGCIFAADPLIQAKASDCSPQKRRKMAEQLIAWAEQLNATADVMDGKPILRNLN